MALGARIRATRIAAGLSQLELGQAVDISHQQIRKYELGQDRVAASTLRDIAVAVRVHPSFFYDDDVVVPSASVPEVKAAWRYAESLLRVSDPDIAAQVMALVRAIAKPA